MSTYLNKQNTFALFSWLNQGTDEFRMWCTIFAACTNARFNWVLKEAISLDDIRDIWWIQKLAWELSDTDGAYLMHSAKAVAEYYGLNLITFKKDSKLFEEALELGYMIEVWLSVNQEFYDDYIDWSIDKFKDYMNYKWDKFKHAFNVYRWKGRFKYGIDFKGYNKECIYDNYMWKEWRVNSIDVNIEEMKDVMYNTCYLFI